MKRKWLAVGIILLFVGVANPPGTNAKMPVASEEANTISASIIPMNNGTLSGYVTDTAMNPIEGARVRVYFHNTSRENYSDATGYYHVTDIPICNCTKNATCSKEGYYTAWVYLSIWENTTYNFTLIEKGHWFYVGGSGSGNYTRIQDAIDNASDGDTVFVYDDSSPYYQIVRIKKSINLIGENYVTTIIDGNHSGDVVAISKSSVNLSGFTIRNSGEYPSISAGIQLFTGLGDITIFDNILSNNYQGIDNYANSRIHIYNNIFSENSRGIDFFYGKSCSVHNNLFVHNSYGITALGALGGSNSIFSNEFRGNDIGINFFRYQKAEIYRNNFINNTKHAHFVNDQGFLINAYDKQTWYRNYWDDCNNLIVKVIVGEGRNWIKYKIYDFDWFPAHKPYDIPGVN
ncbi:hypothetical protein AYK25_04970 [Thermoplasmatales archaeon SM1-50]|nr:MAG: hypothetical protein AYK25_04970 [Thermoplasmatales archaeon SM1-50]